MAQVFNFTDYSSCLINRVGRSGFLIDSEERGGDNVGWEERGVERLEIGVWVQRRCERLRSRWFVTAEGEVKGRGRYET